MDDKPLSAASSGYMSTGVLLRPSIIQDEKEGLGLFTARNFKCVYTAGLYQGIILHTTLT